jgi:hypothetical protein
VTRLTKNIAQNFQSSFAIYRQSFSAITFIINIIIVVLVVVVIILDGQGL